MITRRWLFTLALPAALAAFAPEPQPAYAAQVVCIAADGALTVREKKCPGGESRATMVNLPQGGAKGATGAAGPRAIGVPRVEKISDKQGLSFSGQSFVFAFCDRDEVVIGGGCGCFEVGSCNSAISSTGPMPIAATEGARIGWRCSMVATHNTATDSGEFGSYSVCTRISQ